MNIFHIIVTAVLTTLVIVLLGVAAVWSLWPATAEASAALAAHRWHAGGNSNGDDNHCGHLSGNHLELGQAALSGVLDLDGNQKAALVTVTNTLAEWQAQIQSTCEGVDFTSLDSSLAGMEAFLNQSAATMTNLRPAVSTFYASLTPEQQQVLQDFVHNHHGHGRRRGHGWFH